MFVYICFTAGDLIVNKGVVMPFISLNLSQCYACLKAIQYRLPSVIILYLEYYGLPEEWGCFMLLCKGKLYCQPLLHMYMYLILYY